MNSGFFLPLAFTPVACCVETNRQQRLGQGEEMEREPVLVKGQSTGSACCSHMGTLTGILSCECLCLSFYVLLLEIVAESQMAAWPSLFSGTTFIAMCSISVWM